MWVDDAEFGAQAVLVGALARARSSGNETVRFRYADEWLSRGRHAFAIDPELPLTPGDFFPSGGAALHRVFRDCAPDRWGRVLMERREAEEARLAAERPRRLSDWDFLAGVSDTARMGALRLRDPQTSRWVDDRVPGVPPAARLRELEAAARSIDEQGAHAQSDRALTSASTHSPSTRAMHARTWARCARPRVSTASTRPRLPASRRARGVR